MGYDYKTHKMKNKKAQGHVEIIVSFTIFIGFLLAILYFLTPAFGEKTSYASLNALEERLLDNLSVSYTRVSLSLTDSWNGECFSVDNLVGITGDILVEDFAGNIVPANASSSKITIEGDGDFYIIYSMSGSGGFNTKNVQSSSCPSIPRENYSFGAPSINKFVLLENLQDLNDDYDPNYPEIKNELGLADDFEFAVYDLNREVVMNDSLSFHKVKLSSVLSRDILLQSINRNATLQGLIINLRAW